MVDEVVNVPKCASLYLESDQTCNGDGAAEAPCTWRDRCIALTKVREKQGVAEANQPAWLETIKPNIDDVIKQGQEGAKKGKANGKPKDKPKPAPKPEAAAPEAAAPEAAAPEAAAPEAAAPEAAQPEAKPKKEKDISKFDAVMPLMNDIAEKVAAGMGVKLHQSKADAAAGDLYLVNRLMGGGYVSIYRRMERGRERGLAALRPKNRTTTVDVQLAGVPPKEWDHKEWPDGFFKTVVKGIGADKTAAMAATIVDMVKSGAIDLSIIELNPPGRKAAAEKPKPKEKAKKEKPKPKEKAKKAEQEAPASTEAKQ